MSKSSVDIALTDLPLGSSTVGATAAPVPTQDRIWPPSASELTPGYSPDGRTKVRGHYGQSGGLITGSGATGEAAVRILNYPLVAPNSSGVLGVMQVTVALPVDSLEMDDLCEDISRAVACALYNEYSCRAVDVKLNKLEESAVAMLSQCDAAMESRELWQLKSSALAAVNRAIQCTLSGYRAAYVQCAKQWEDVTRQTTGETRLGRDQVEGTIREGEGESERHKKRDTRVKPLSLVAASSSSSEAEAELTRLSLLQEQSSSTTLAAALIQEGVRVALAEIGFAIIVSQGPVGSKKNRKSSSERTGQFSGLTAVGVSEAPDQLVGGSLRLPLGPDGTILVELVEREPTTRYSADTSRVVPVNTSKQLEANRDAVAHFFTVLRDLDQSQRFYDSILQQYLKSQQRYYGSATTSRIT